MFCHRTIGPRRPRYGSSNNGGPVYREALLPVPHECIGSRCSLWVPQVRDQDNQLLHDRHVDLVGIFSETGLGSCADNLWRDPWPDPSSQVAEE